MIANIDQLSWWHWFTFMTNDIDLHRWPRRLIYLHNETNGLLRVLLCLFLHQAHLSLLLPPLQTSEQERNRNHHRSCHKIVWHCCLGWWYPSNLLRSWLLSSVLRIEALPAPALVHLLRDVDVRLLDLLVGDLHHAAIQHWDLNAGVRVTQRRAWPSINRWFLILQNS